ncbi:4'-phosphopantetheinyl transferase family protein [Paenibacillus sp. SYP-B4298]|uniref:4'-phosphopantetheinyl transferase family protein n=1 Tax=Paenibacillus sp. SYP-B4298 TaxID=2996034 RepID=UPI0022DE25C7|nr:4'-phosphopantetheinyl transferase superfamily protein [Paenibacillus sp. SYP-B4298]
MHSSKELNPASARFGAHIIAMQVPEQLEEDVYRHLLSDAAPDKQQRIERYVRRADAYRSLLADAIVRRRLATLLRVKTSALTFSSNAYGKPYVEQAEGLHFNTTHSGQWVAVVFSDEPSGIDVEIMKKSDSLPLARRFFSPTEYEAIQSSDQQLQTFYTYWSMKESYIKALGLGLSKELTSFTVLIGEDGSADVEDEGRLSSYRIYPFELDKDYSSTVCLKAGCRIGAVEVWGLAALLEASNPV